MKEKDEYCIKVGKNIVEARQKKKISQKELAEKLQISPTRLNYWEKGKAKPDIKMVQQIAAILDVSPASLLGWDEFDKKNPNIGKEVKQFESFLLYLKSLGYSVDSEVIKWHYEDVIENGVIVGQGQVEDESCIIVNSKSSNVKATFTEEEFQALQDKNKETLEGAILLQSQKNKKEPSSAATDNGSDNESTIK